VRYVIDPMTMADVPRVIEIERLAYPSTWPPSAYRKELQDNRWAHYIVLRDKHILDNGQTALVGPSEQEKPRKSRLFPLSLLPNRPALSNPVPELAAILGFAGLWLMVDEAHITTIAMHPEFRRLRSGLRWKLESPIIPLRVSIASMVSVKLAYAIAIIAIIKKMRLSCGQMRFTLQLIKRSLLN
jgi:ribosomal protein S18 acetylase RimI-like enzyme